MYYWKMINRCYCFFINIPIIYFEFPLYFFKSFFFCPHILSWYWIIFFISLGSISLSVFCKTWRMVTNSLSFCLFLRVFILSSFIDESFPAYSILCCQFVPFKAWTASLDSLLACRVSDGKSALSLIGCPLKISSHFSPAHFSIIYSCFTFENLTLMCLDEALFWSCLRVLCASCSWSPIFLWINEVFCYYFTR